jgi:hypothetical protein
MIPPRKNKVPKDLGNHNRLRDLQHVEDVFPSARACPFPYLKDRPSPGRILEGKVTRKEIDIKSLYAGQLAVSKKKVREIMQEIKDGKYSGHENHSDKIVVVEHEGKNFIWSGHHHATALLLSGVKRVAVVHHIELEKL